MLSYTYLISNHNTHYFALQSVDIVLITLGLSSKPFIGYSSYLRIKIYIIPVGLHTVILTSVYTGLHILTMMRFGETAE